MELHRAVFENDIYEVRKILEKHSDINKIDNNGNTALHIACMKRNVSVIQTLLNYGAELNEQNKSGQTPLMVTMYGNDCISKAKHRTKKEVKAAMSFLLNRGADPNIVDSRGDTVLHQAVRKFIHRSIKKQCVALLIQSKVNVETLNKQGKTAYDLAVEWSSPKLILMFNIYVSPGVSLTSKEINQVKEGEKKKENEKKDDDTIIDENETKTDKNANEKINDDTIINEGKTETDLITAEMREKIHGEIEKEIQKEVQKVLARYGAQYSPMEKCY